MGDRRKPYAYQEPYSGLPDTKEANVPKKMQAGQVAPGGPVFHLALKISHRKLTGFPTLAQTIGPGSPLEGKL